MQGRRVYPESLERGVLDSEPGDYFRDETGDWRGKTPNALDVWLKNHHVEEHGDGTISVIAGPWGSNSILASNSARSWHGYVEQGFWRTC